MQSESEQALHTKDSNSIKGIKNYEDWVWNIYEPFAAEAEKMDKLTKSRDSLPLQKAEREGRDTIQGREEGLSAAGELSPLDHGPLKSRPSDSGRDFFLW